MLGGLRAGPSQAPPAGGGVHLLGADLGRKLAGPGLSALSSDPPVALLPNPGLCQASVPWAAACPAALGPHTGVSPSTPALQSCWRQGVCARNCPGLQSWAERRAPSRRAHTGTWQRDSGTHVSLGP